MQVDASSEYQRGVVTVELITYFSEEHDIVRWHRVRKYICIYQKYADQRPSEAGEEVGFF